jgi:chromosome segregation ATPase
LNLGMAEPTSDNGGQEDEDDPIFTNKDKDVDWSAVLKLRDSNIVGQILQADKDGVDETLKRLIPEIESQFPILASSKIDFSNADVSIDSLHYLFQLSQAVMELKSFRHQEAKETIKSLKQEVRQQDEEIEKLQSDLAKKSLKGSGGSDGGQADSAALRRKDQELKLAKQEKDGLNEDLRNAKQAVDEKNRALQDEQAKIRELENEISKLKEDLSKLMKQNHDLKQEIEDEEKKQQSARKQSQKINREALKFVQEVGVLSQRVHELEQERVQIIQEKDKRIDEVLDLRDQLKEANSKLEMSYDQCAQLEEDNHQLTEKVAELRACEEERDEEHEKIVKDITKVLQSLREDVSRYKTDLEIRDDELKEAKATVLQLKKENQQSESERRFHELQSELERVNTEMSNEMDNRVQVQKENASLRGEIRILEEVLKKQQKQLQAQYKEKENELRAFFHEKQEAMIKTIKANADYKRRVEELEDEQIELKEMISKLENGTFGLAEAMSKVRALQRDLDASKKSMSQRTKGYNDARIKIEKLYAEVILLRKHLVKLDPELKATAGMIGFQELGFEEDKSELNWIGQKDGFCLDIGAFKVGTAMELEKAKAMNLQLEREVEALEVERLDMKSQLRLLALLNGERAAKLGLTAADVQKLDSFVEHLKSGEAMSLEFASSEAENIKLRKLTQRVSVLEKELGEKEAALATSQDAISKLTEQLRTATSMQQSFETLKIFVESAVRDQGRYFPDDGEEEVVEPQAGRDVRRQSNEGTQTTPARSTPFRSPTKSAAQRGLGYGFGTETTLTPQILDQLAKALREGELADQANVNLSIKAIRNLPPSVVNQVYVVASINRSTGTSNTYSLPLAGSKQISLHEEIHRLAVSNRSTDSIVFELFEAPEKGRQDRSSDRLIGKGEISVDSFGRAADKTWSGNIESWISLHDLDGRTVQGISGSKQHRTEIQFLAKFLEAPSKRAQTLEEQVEAMKEISAMKNQRLENCERDLLILRDDLKRKNEDLDQAVAERNVLRKELQQARMNSSLSLSRVLQISAVGRVGNDGKFVPDSDGDTIDSGELMNLIADLNAHLIEALDHLSKREDEVTSLEAELQRYSEDVGVLRLQQVMLYKEHTERVGALENDVKKYLKEWTKATDQGKLEAAKASAALEKLALLSSSSLSQERQYAIDAERKIIVLESERDELSRSNEAIKQELAELRDNYDVLVLDMARQQHRLKQRIGRLDRTKAAAERRLAQRQRQLDNAVPQEQFSVLHHEHLLLKERYAILVTEGSKALLEQATIQGQRQRAEKLSREKEESDIQLKEATDRSNALLGRLEILSLKDGPPDRQLLTAMSEKLVKLEVSERNFARRHELCLERLRAAEQERGRMEERIAFLEQETVEKAALVQRLQEAERTLQNRLEKTISTDEANDLKALVERQGEEILELKGKCQKFEEIAELATDQAKAMEELQGIHKEELESLRAFSMQVQADSENAAELSVLNRKVVDRDRRIHELNSKVSSLDRELARLDGCVVRLEESLERKEEEIHRIAEERMNERKRLQAMIDDLKLRAAGQIPLDKADEWAASLRELTEHKQAAVDEVAVVRKAKLEAEQRVETLQIELDDHRRVLALIREEQRQESPAGSPTLASSAMDKLASQAEELTKLKIENIRMARQLKQLQEREAYLEQSGHQSEREIRRLEEALVHAQAERDSQAQESHDELVAQVANLQMKVKELERVEPQVQVRVQKSTEPARPSQPVGTNSGTQPSSLSSDFETIAAMHDKMIQLSKQLEDRQTEVDRLKHIIEAGGSNAARTEREYGESSKLAVAAEHTQEVAKLTIDRLEKNIERKNGLIAKYQQQLREAREEYMLQKELDANAIEDLREKLAAKINESIHQMRSKVQGSQPQMVLSGTTAAEADAIMAEKSKLITALNEDLKLTKERLEALEVEKSRDLEEVNKRLEASKLECEKLLQELQKASEEKPSKKIEALVQGLKSQLAEKEMKQREMKGAIEALKEEMIKAAEAHSKSVMVAPHPAGGKTSRLSRCLEAPSRLR